MALFDLPVELRLHIYAFIPQLSPNQHRTISLDLDRQTPAICRTNRQLRFESLPLYICNSEFAIQIPNSGKQEKESPCVTWLHSLGTLGLPHIRNLQLNRHWSIRHPSRYEGHVGFYVRFSKFEGSWRCAVGTYPAAKDSRGRRIESVDLLHRALRRAVLERMEMREKPTLRSGDLTVVMAGMKIVGNHPIEAFFVDHEVRDLIWASMEEKLAALMPSLDYNNDDDDEVEVTNE